MRLGWGGLGDERAIEPLLYAARSRPAVAVASVVALAGWPETAPALGSLLAFSRPDTQRAAAEALGRMQTESAADYLIASLADPGMRSDLRQLVMETITAQYPHRLSETAGVLTSDGAPWLVSGGAVGLGYLLASAGHFGQSDLETLGAITGGLGGGT